ncbi:hypothetical protein ACET3Z_028634 [Daucus carota]
MRTLHCAGESYAGKYVPELAGLIQKNNKDLSLHIDLMRILVGESYDFYSNNTWSNRDCSQAVDEVLKQYNEIDIYSLYTSVCSEASKEKLLKIMYRSKSKMMPRIIGGYDPSLDDYAKINFNYNKHDVQKALQVTEGHHIKNWSICNLHVAY